MRFDIGDEVYILYKAEDQKSGWQDDMDKTVGWIGTVDSIHHLYGYKVAFDEIDEKYFYNEGVVGDYDDYENKQDEIKNKGGVWAIAPISGRIYKFVSKENGFNVYEDKDGTRVTTEFFYLDAAPRVCKSFNWVPPGN